MSDSKSDVGGQELGGADAQPALVSDQAPAGLGPSGFDQAQHAPGPFRVVRREYAGGRIWDVYGDHIGDYLATMNPTLPVSSKSVAERICNSANVQHLAAIAKARGAA